MDQVANSLGAQVCQAGANDIWCVMQSALDSVVNFAWPAATALAGVGILTMALIEILKELGRFKARFRRKEFKTIFVQQFCRGPLDANTKTRCEDAVNALQELEGLLTYGDVLNIYDDKLDKMIVRMGAAFRTAVDDANTYFNVVVGLAPRIGNNTLAILKEGLTSDPIKRERFVQAKALVMGLNQHFLAAVSSQLAKKWERRVQGASVLLSMVIIGLGAYWFYKDKSPGGPTFFFWSIIAVFGGTVAPVAKNIVTALRNVKERTR